MNNIRRRVIDPAPVKMLLILSSSIFVGEILIMLLVHALPPLSIWMEILMDSTLLVILIFPLLYFFVFRPFVTRSFELLQSNEKLMESEQQYRSLTEFAITGVYLIQERLFRYVNPVLANMFGYEVDEIVNKLSPLDLTAPEDRYVVAENVRKRIEGEAEHIRYSFKGLRKDGRLIDIEVHGVRIDYKGKPAVLGTILDITEQKRVEKALIQSEQNFKSLINTIEGIVWEADAKTFIFSFVSKQAERILGYPIEQWLNEPTFWKDHIHHEDRNWAVDFCIERTRTKQMHDFEYRMVTQDRHVIWLRDIVTVVVENNEAVTLRGVMVDVTKKKLAEEKLRETSEYLNNLFNYANAPIIVWDSELHITRFNYVFEHLSGYKAEEVLGKKLDFLFPKETKRELLSKIGQTSSDEYRKSVEIPILQKNGEVRIVLWNFANILNKENKLVSTIAQGQDITERKRAEKALQESEERFRSVTQSANDAIITANCKGIILDWNRGAEKIFGYTEAEITGKELTIIMPNVMLNSIIKGVKRIEQDGEHHIIERTVELHGMHKSGKEFPLELSLAEWETASGKFFTVIIRDITERKRVEEELIKAKELAEQSDKLKTEFLSQMSHEIRTPINVITSNVSFIKDELGDKIAPEDNDCFKSIAIASKRIIRTIDLILNVSELQTSVYKPLLRKIDIDSQVLKKSFDEYYRTAKYKGVDLIYKIETEKPTVVADEYCVTQIFANLIDNAVKYTKKGKVEIFVTNNSSGEVVVEIKDTGIGISKDFLPHIFEPFVQEEQGYTRSYEGNGLGLALVKRYCDMNNASIQVESEKNVGSTFRVVFRADLKTNLFY